MSKRNNTTTSLVSLAIIAILVTSCSDSTENKTNSGTVKIESATLLTEEYFLGEWCHVYSQSSDERTEENMNWVFDKEGLFFEQASQFSKELKHRANWKIVDDRLDLGVRMMGGPHKVIILSKEEFVLDFFVDHHVTRGKCRS